jgi:hypothetical protein
MLLAMLLAMLLVLVLVLMLAMLTCWVLALVNSCWLLVNLLLIVETKLLVLWRLCGYR